MDAVVVARAEVEGGELAILELRRQTAVAADQRGGGVEVALGLEDLVAFDRTELADRAVDRAQVVGLGEGPYAFAQRAGEELIEGRVAGGVGMMAL